jgi:hypothetical protein
MVATDTIVRLENGREMKPRTVDAIRSALEAVGVEFTNGDQPGVRMRKKAEHTGEMEEGHLRRKSIPHPSYPFENATHWRMRAEKMRTLAEEDIDSTVRAMMLRIAADYDRLAESADDRAAHDSIMFRTAESEA